MLILAVCPIVPIVKSCHLCFLPSFAGLCWLCCANFYLFYSIPRRSRSRTTRYNHLDHCLVLIGADGWMLCVSAGWRWDLSSSATLWYCLRLCLQSSVEIISLPALSASQSRMLSMWVISCVFFSDLSVLPSDSVAICVCLCSPSIHVSGLSVCLSVMWWQRCGEFCWRGRNSWCLINCLCGRRRSLVKKIWYHTHYKTNQQQNKWNVFVQRATE